MKLIEVSVPSVPPTALWVVGAAIVDDARGRCLVAQRSASMSNPQAWEFPGGKVEAGESPADALTRELQEELGVVAEVGDWIGRGEVLTPRHIALDVFRCRILAGTPEPREHAALRWVDGNRLQSLSWAAADVPVLSAVQAMLAKG